MGTFYPPYLSLLSFYIHATSLPRAQIRLKPLDDSISFRRSGDFVNPRQPQLELRPFDADRLREVALKLRDLFPASDRPRLERRVSLELIDKLVAKVSEGFRGDVGVIPRQFLRKLLDVLDLVDREEAYDPMAAEGFEPEEPTEVEARIHAGRPIYDGALDDEEPYEPVSF